MDEIAKILDDLSFDRRVALIAQRKAVISQNVQAKELIRGIDEALALISRKSRKDLDMATLFRGFDPSLFQDEAKTRWGKTKEWATSDKRTTHYSKADWELYNTEHNAMCTGFANLAKQGLVATSEYARHLVRAYVDLIDRWFYPCDVRQMATLADVYDGDSRFRETFDEHGDGASRIVIEAFRAYQTG